MGISSALHRWPTTTEGAKSIQEEIRKLVVTRNRLKEVRLVAGVDTSYHKSKRLGWAGIVVLTYPDMKLVERRYAHGTVRFPYVPGFLSFREGPIIVRAFRTLSCRPDLLLFDGQGVAHPRGCGLASHMGVLLGLPSIGVAKSRLLGSYDLPAEEAGAHTELRHSGGAVIGAVVRTRSGVKPLFVSIGHKVNLATAIHYVLSCCRGYRVPEPVRQADILVQQLRRS